MWQGVIYDVSGGTTRKMIEDTNTIILTSVIWVQDVQKKIIKWHKVKHTLNKVENNK